MNEMFVQLRRRGRGLYNEGILSLLASRITCNMVIAKITDMTSTCRRKGRPVSWFNVEKADPSS